MKSTSIDEINLHPPSWFKPLCHFETCLVNLYGWSLVLVLAGYFVVGRLLPVTWGIHMFFLAIFQVLRLLLVIFAEKTNFLQNLYQTFYFNILQSFAYILAYYSQSSHYYSHDFYSSHGSNSSYSSYYIYTHTYTDTLVFRSVAMYTCLYCI